MNIDPFRFLNFVETGLVPEKYLCADPEAINISIFFIGEYNKKLYLMNYKMYPWPVQKNLVDEFNKTKLQFQDQIQIMSGHFDPYDKSNYLGPNYFTPEKILNASLL